MLASWFAGLPDSAARAGLVTLSPASDASLLEVAPDNNLGGASFFNAGTAGNGRRNRALLMFDLVGVIPMDSVITSVSLQMEMVRQPAVGLAASQFSLHRVEQAWGEGLQVPADPESPGIGAPALEGEATWNSRLHSTVPWAVPGGLAGTDFSPTVSGFAFVADLGEVVRFDSSSGLLADVQYWLANPSANHGWMFKPDNEALRKTARSFASSESEYPPMLTVEFTPVPEPSAIALLGLGLVGLACGRLCQRGEDPSPR
jgi:hypothetical protein